MENENPVRSASGEPLEERDSGSDDPVFAKIISPGNIPPIF
jgi:hypothetical protein